MSDSESDSHPIEQFNVENPPNYNKKRGSTSSSDSEDDIIFKNEVTAADLGLNSSLTKNKVYCGLRGDSEISAILNVSVSAIGGGCFGFPFIMYDGGIIVSLLIFLFVTACIFYSIDLLRSFIVETKYFSFALMTETILGSNWLKLYSICSLLIYMSMEVSYLSSIYIYIQGMFDLDGILFHILYFLISIIIEALICLYISKIDKMHLLSIISITCFFFLLISIIISSIIAKIKGEVGDKFTSNNLFFPNIIPDTIMNRLLKISSYMIDYVFAFSYHSTFPTLFGNLDNLNHKNSRKVHLISFTIVFSAYLLITIFGFLLSDKVPIELFQERDRDFSDGWVYLRIPVKFVLCIYLLTLVPIRFIVLRDNYITLIGKKKISSFKEFIIIIIFIFICNVFVLCVGLFEKMKTYDLDLKNLARAFGGMFGIIISFYLPIVNYISVNGKKKIRSWIGYIITGFFLIIGCLSTAYSIYQIIFGKDITREKKRMK